MTEIEILQYLIYFIFIFSLMAYSVLDGFDLGVGCLHLFARNDQERRLMINAIGPVWDGNTTWIVIGGGILFAGFPKVYASLMAGLYTPVMCYLFGIMLRGAAIEFRGKRESKKWRYFWDYAFFFASLLLALNVGIALGNLIEGFPLNAKGEMQADLGSLLSPYPLLIGIFGVSAFMMHGSIYLLMKTEGRLHDHFRLWSNRLIILFLILFAITSIITFTYRSHMIDPFTERPYLLVFPILSFCLIIGIPVMLAWGYDGWAFICSSLAILFFLVLYAIGTFPNIVYSTLNPAQNSLTIFNSSSTKITLYVLAIIALIGAPLSFFYFSYIYRIFRGKIRLDSMSY